VNVEHVYARCIEEGDCLLWQGYCAPKGVPQMSDGETRRSISARRWLYQQMVGRVPDGKQVCVTCGNRLCLAREHMKPLTQREKMNLAASRGACSRPDATVNRTLAKRRRAKLTAEQVRSIRRRIASGEAYWRIASDVGVCTAHIGQIAVNKRWREVTANASVFNMRSNG